MMPRRRKTTTILMGTVSLALLMGAVAMAMNAQPTNLAQPVVQPPSFESAFWNHWSDGQAELAGYRLTFPRYGEQHEGSAVTIFVTERFSNELRVKADPGNHPESDTFPVMKLNLVQDFPTGIYDYNLMTSAFVALESVNDYPAGTPTKIAFSSQEWCGLVHGQYLFNDDHIDYTLHSYFDGEADRRTQLPTSPQPLVEDALLMWARGFTGPTVEPGEQVTDYPMLRGLQYTRLHHEKPSWVNVTLSRSEQTKTIEVPAGTFEVESRTVAIDDGRTWTFHIQPDPPHQIIKWTTSDGQTAEMTGVVRNKYWQMNGSRFRETVEELGLDVRPPGNM